jgi:hypothetical protein
MTEMRKMNKSRSKTFGVVLNPTLGDLQVDWKSLTEVELILKLKELGFPSTFDLTETLNLIEFKNVNDTLTVIEDFEGQFELGTESCIPHYQLAIKTKSICTKKPILEAFQQVLNAHVNIDIQFDFENMKKYCSKESDYHLDGYSGRIFKHQWKLNFIERKPELKQVLENPYPWQKFFLEQILSSTPDSRTVDWLVDPVGNTGKSSFARAYVSTEPTDAIIMKMDNHDRMELAFIYKITSYRDRYNKDPKIVFFDFPRATDQKKVMAATALMEDAKSGHLETTFGGKHREVQISNVHIVVLANFAPDLSVLSVDRWRVWRLGGQEYNNIIWPCKPTPVLWNFDSSSKFVEWGVRLDNISPSHLETMSQYKKIDIDSDWAVQEPTIEASSKLEVFSVQKQFTKKLNSSMNDAPNDIRILIFNLLRDNDLLQTFDKNGIIVRKKKNFSKK